jgi:hypothetical protein
VRPEVKSQGDAVKRNRADVSRLQLREVALGKRGVALQEFVANDKTQNRVAQELELLVVVDATAVVNFGEDRTMG